MDTTKKISAGQLETLHAFIKKHYVEYYDLQNELADHMANAIEERWAVTPGLTFDDALQQEFKKFGVFGFTGIVEQREQALTKRYHKLMWGYFKQFLKLPYIMLTLAMVFAVFKIMEYSMFWYSVLEIAIMLFGGYKIIAINKDYKKKVKRTGKRWLFEDIIMRFGGGGGFTYMSFYGTFFMVYDEGQPPVLVMIIMSVFLTVFTLCLYITIYKIPSKAKEHLIKTYQEYKYVN